VEDTAFKIEQQPNDMHSTINVSGLNGGTSTHNIGNNNDTLSPTAAETDESHLNFLRNHSSVKLRHRPPTAPKRKNKGLYYYERKLFKLNKHERLWLLAGTVSQMIYGSILPAISLVFSEIFYIFALPDERAQRSLALNYCGIILGIAVVNLATTILHSYAFALAGAKLTKRLRVKMFESMLRQEVAFHDLDENRSSILSTKLSASAPLCKGLTTDKLSLFSQGFAGMGFAVVTALLINWKLALAMLAFVPVTFVNGVLAGRSSTNTKVKGKFSNEEGGRITVETVESIRTIVSLGREDYFVAEFKNVFDKKFHKQLAILHIQAFFYSMTNSLMFFIQATAFGLGYYLMKHEDLSVTNIFRIYSSITFSSMILGRVYSQLPDQRKSRDAAKTAFKLINRKSRMDAMSDEGLKPARVVGDIRFDNVHFHYPTRPNVKVLNGFTLAIASGQTNALVGSSGCGKSTTVALLLRFYDVDHGAVLLDGVDIRKLNLNWLRSHIGLVSQEPVLFNTTIFENICYGDVNRTDVRDLEKNIK
jgi:ATP-binding cassette subfamily B (MDR/TAP) protein 1